MKQERIGHTGKSLAGGPREALYFMQAALDRSPEGIFFIEPGGRFAYVNEALCRSLRYTREELLELSVRDIDADSNAEGSPWDADSLNSTPAFECRFRAKNGNVFPVRISSRYLELGTVGIHCAYVQSVDGGGGADDGPGTSLSKNREQSQRTDALRQITLAINSTLDLSVVLHRLLEKIDLLPYAAATLRLYSRKTGRLESMGCHNLGEAEWKADTENLPRGLSQRVFQTGKLIVSEDLRNDPRLAHPHLLMKYGFVSFLGLPLVARGVRLGVLSFYTKTKHIFTKDEIEFLSLIGAQAAVAIYNSQLYEETKQNSARLALMNQQLAALYEITATMSQSLDLDSVLQQVIDKITEIFQFDTTRVFLFDAKMQEVSLRAGFEREAALWARVSSFKKGEGIVGRVAETGKAVIYEDVKSDPEYLATSRTKNVVTTKHAFFAVLPIKSRSQIWGTIVCIGREPRKLSFDELQLLTSMANQIGIAVENGNLFQETRDRAEQLSMLYSLATVLNQSLDMEATLRDAVHRILEMLGFEAGRLYVLPEDSHELELLAKEGLPEELEVPKRYRPGEGTVGRVFASGVPLFFEDMRRDAIFARRCVMARAGYVCQFFIPVRVKGKVIGVLNIASTEIRRFSEREEQLIDAIANQVGVAVENSSLFRQVQRRSHELDALAQINRDIAALLDRDTLLPRIIEDAKKLLEMDDGSLHFLDGERIGGNVSYGPVMLREPSGQQSGGRDLELPEDRVVAISSVVDDPRLVESCRSNLLRSGNRSVLMAPLRVGPNVIGAINLLSREKREFSSDAVALMRSFAAQAAIAIQNANLFTEIREKARQLEALNLELQEANRVKTDFVNAMSHELRTPLTATMGYIGLLLDGYGGDLTQIQAEALENVNHQSELLLKLINDILTLGQLEAGRTALNVREATLDEMFRHVRAYAAQLDQQRPPVMRWEIEEGLPPLKTDHMKLEEILQNLIGNAYKFTAEGEIVVRVRDLKAETNLEFIVEDTGMGIELAEVDRIFDAFHQSADAHTGNLGGVGLGLSIVKKYLDLMHGRIRVESLPGRGSRFIFTLPYAI